MHTPLFQLVEDARASLRRGTLYVVPTPIGNLTDITARALAVLSTADVICAEDTRVSAHLLQLYGLPRREMISLREHNERSQVERILGWLREGKMVAQISDAGTPAISDPGARLVEAVHAAGLPICPIPGASSFTTAVSGAGLQANAVLFYGFLPPKTTARRKIYAGWKTVDYAVTLFEAPHRIAESLADLVAELGPDRYVVLARELTKTFETLKRGTAAEILAWVQSDSNQQRGECVLLIDQAPIETDNKVSALVLRTLETLVEHLPVKQAAGVIADLTGENRKHLYELGLEMKKSRQRDEENDF